MFNILCRIGKIKTNKIQYSVIKDWYTHMLNLFCVLDEDTKLLYLLEHTKQFQSKHYYLN